MTRTIHFRRLFVTTLALCGLAWSSMAAAEDLYLADRGVFPGELWRSDALTAERSIHRRAARADRAFPDAIMKIGQVAVGPDNKVYYCSGLDGYVMTLLDGRHEIQALHFDGQVRDVACTGEEHTVYFSVVPTPQNSQPLADGKIYRRDFWEGRASEVATVRQADVGNQWWGGFTIKDGHVYLATLGDHSDIYRVTSTGPERVFTSREKILGLTAGPDRDFYYTTGDGNVYRTTDFATAEVLLRTGRRLSDVGLRASAEAARP